MAKEPTFQDLVTTLSEADLLARSSAADAGQAREQRSTVAVSTIKAAFAEKINVSDVREALLTGGVLKGTVSKIATVLTALHTGIIEPKDVKSLNGAYGLIKAIESAASTPAAPGSAPGVPFAASVPPVAATTPEDAFNIIINAIKSVGDIDEAFKLGGEWITKVTNGITDALRERETEEDSE